MRATPYPLGSRDGAVARALASYQCVPGSSPGPSAICGLSLLLVLFSALRGFSPGPSVFPSPQKPTFPHSNLIWNCQALYHEPLARVTAQALPVFDIKFDLHLRFTSFLAPKVTTQTIPYQLRSGNTTAPKTMKRTKRANDFFTFRFT